ncbi:kunitz/Bovine pancreatic trypsin inhibitor domain-containing protein [Ditylenchus destructor]|uniref:Kunitz/Bovine pancreatic trypsin inhibitor domain-containing protein n=1 Tax=Ditylenchus destructor TaxID=166010 RepID=A0AAD4MRX9_9BILA|nr:kunitz/Bovine pancreatic trypsin inhibitor domain-containing protein [Ditylenchus destructor]
MTKDNTFEEIYDDGAALNQELQQLTTHDKPLKTVIEQANQEFAHELKKKLHLPTTERIPQDWINAVLEFLFIPRLILCDPSEMFWQNKDLPLLSQVYLQLSSLELLIWCRPVVVYFLKEHVCRDAVTAGTACFGAFLPIQRFHYNADRGQCEPFQYYGCNGSGNNFVTKRQYKAACQPQVKNG